MGRRVPRVQGNDGKPFTIVIDKYGKGVMTLFDETRLPLDSVFQAQNMMLDQDGVWTVRPGSAPYGQTLTTPIDGAGSFAKYNTDGSTDTYIWVIDNGAFKYSQDGGNWTTKTGKTWTTGYPVFSRQFGKRIYFANGQDTMAYYDIDTDTLTTFTALSAPSNLSASKTGLSNGSYNVYYKVTAVNEVGETLASSEASVSSGINATRENWEIGTDYVTLSWDVVSNATRYNIYYSDESGKQVFLDSSPTNSYIDTGVAVANPYQETPETDTTAGPKYGYLTLSGNRLWGTRDPNLPYRVGWTGTGQYFGAFNPFYGGGYIDLNKGSDERVEAVVHFRDGRGNAVATALTSSPSGAGSTWHIALTTLTVDTINIIVPQAYQQQGAVGTRSPRGVVEYNDSVYFPSPKGFHSTGSKQSILNVLVTNEISDNIRPSVQGISNMHAEKIAGYGTNGRIYWSVPAGSSENNQIWVLDLERGGSWALPWSFGVKQFFEYADSNGIIRLLAVPASGDRLIQFGNNITGDSGVAFSTNLQSGLVHWEKSHIGWAYVEKVYCEIADPVGSINFTISGTQKGKSFSSLKSVTISDTASSNGMSADLWDDFLWGGSNVTDASFNQTSVKKYVRINKLLTNLRWQFTTNSLNSRYTPMQVVIKGTILPTSDPSSYRA